MNKIKLGWMKEFHNKSGTWLLSWTWTNWTFGFAWMRLGILTRRQTANLHVFVDIGPFEISWTAP